MKEFKGTPAPWVVRTGDQTDFTGEKFNFLYVSPESNIKSLIADCKTVSAWQLDPDEEIANAYLISAAPDLLEAAQHCREVIERASFTEENRKRAISALSQLNAAISKALTHS